MNSNPSDKELEKMIKKTEEQTKALRSLLDKLSDQSKKEQKPKKRTL